MSLVALPVRAPIVTTVSDGNVPPFNVAVTVTDVAASSSPRLEGLALRVIPDASSSSAMVVVTVAVVLRVGAGPPPPDGLEMLTVNVSPVPSSTSSSVVCTVNVWDPAAVLVNVRVPALAS